MPIATKHVSTDDYNTGMGVLRHLTDENELNKDLEDKSVFMVAPLTAENIGEGLARDHKGSSQLRRVEGLALIAKARALFLCCSKWMNIAVMRFASGTIPLLSNELRSPNENDIVKAECATCSPRVDFDTMYSYPFEEKSTSEFRALEINSLLFYVSVVVGIASMITGAVVGLFTDSSGH